MLLLLEKRQGLRKVFIVQAFLLLVEGIGLVTQGPIVDETSTSKGASKNMFLLISWVNSLRVCSFLLHVYIIACYGVNIKYSCPAGQSIFIPIAGSKGSSN